MAHHNVFILVQGSRVKAGLWRGEYPQFHYRLLRNHLRRLTTLILRLECVRTRSCPPLPLYRRQESQGLNPLISNGLLWIIAPPLPVLVSTVLRALQNRQRSETSNVRAPTHHRTVLTLPTARPTGLLDRRRTQPNLRTQLAHFRLDRST